MQWIKWSRSWLLAAIALAAASFITLLAAIPEIFVPDTALGWVDAWYYVGFAQRLPESLRQYSTSLYQAERLSWILPGYLLNQVAPPLAANFLLKGAYFAATVCVLFGALRQMCGLRTAAFVSALASLYSFVAHSLGANYVDGAANLYFLIAVYATSHAARRRDGIANLVIPSAFAGGIALVALLLAQLAYLLVVPLFVGYASLEWARSESQRRPPVAAAVASFLAGALTVSLLAVAIYVYWEIPGRPLQLSLGMFHGYQPNAFIAPQSLKWLLRAYWLLLPSAVAAWILPAVIASCRRGWGAALHVPPVYWLFLSVFGLWIFLYLMKAPWLMLPFYASFLIPATFLALGPAAAPLVERLSRRSFWILLGLLFLGTFAVYWRHNTARVAEKAALAAGLCLVLATLVRASNRLAAERRATAALAFLVLGIVGINAATADYTLQTRNAYRYTGMAAWYHEPGRSSHWPVSRLQTFKGAVNAAAMLAPRLRGHHYYFWYDGDDPLGMFFRSIGSMFYAWSTRDLLDERFRRIDDESINWLLPQRGGRLRDLLILTRSPDVRVKDSPLDLQWTEPLSAAGADFYAHYFVVNMVRAAGFEPSPRRLGLASRFPCSLERAGVALWYDRATQTTRSTADHGALLELFSAEQKGPIQCLDAYRTLTDRLATAENGDPYVPSTTTCKSELALAEIYMSEVFDDPLRQATRPTLETARAALQERQIELCRVAVGEIRRAYFDAIFGVRAVPAATSRPRRAAVGVDFDPTPPRIRLASRFPCSLERSAAARWFDRGVNRTSAHRRALEDLLRAEEQSPIRCLSAFKRLTEQLAAADGRDSFMPATATCKSELAIAEVYVSDVFDDALRRATVAKRDAARAAQRNRDERACRLAVSDIRRAYFDAIYGSRSDGDDVH